MPSPATVSLEVPYAENEQQFLVLAVQAAVRTFRRMNAHSAELNVPARAETLSQVSDSWNHMPGILQES
jgi:hypothetical protein